MASGWATNLGNVDEEDVEKDDQGWLLDGQPTWVVRARCGP